MKIHVLTFSPTGTSAKIARAVATAISESINCPDGVCLCDTNLMQADAMQFNDDDIVIIASPVYGGKMAPAAKNRMMNISGHTTPCILVATYGNRAFEHALTDMAAFVAERGFIPVAAGAFVGEHSYSTAEYPIAAGRPDAADLREAETFGVSVAAKINRGEREAVEVERLTDIPSPETSLANFREFVMGYQRAQKENPVKLLPEVDTELCNVCGTCVDVCPTGAIADDCLSLDASKCIKCCACVKSCPAEARSLRSPFAPVLSANFSERKEPVWMV